MRQKYLIAGLLALASAAAVAPLYAEMSPPPQVKSELQAAWTAAKATATMGPADIKLMDQADLRLNPDQVFIPAAEANGIMEAMGNQTTPERYGLIVSRKKGAEWLVDLKWVKEGYVRDGDAKEWQPDALLDNLKQGTEQGNAERLAKGLPALDVIGWVEKPSYDPTTHRLVWSLSLRDRGAPPSEPQTINYNTYALGREGYFSLDLITGSDSIAADKQVAHNLLESLNYIPGKRYQDFNGSTDKVAAYGLAALIGVVAVKKLGLLAVIGVFLLKIWKLGLIAIAAVGSAFRRVFKRRQAQDAEN
jgi:uncharacterized membrane-anchored protein